MPIKYFSVRNKPQAGTPVRVIYANSLDRYGPVRVLHWKYRESVGVPI